MDRHRTRARLLGLLVLLAAIAVGAGVRIQLGLSDPTFDRVHSDRLLKSDPALLYYITEGILESGGWPPADFRADPRVAHPVASDLPAMFTVGQEFLVAWLYAAFGGDTPLHVFALIVMGIVASLAAVGVYGLAYELTGRLRWAAFAAVLYTASPASYRTAGVILIREDLSLPLLALHLYWLARAVRVGTPVSWGLCGLAGLGAVATWHAMGFVVAMELACVFAWFLRTGRSPLAHSNAWVAVLVVALGSLSVPVLQSKLFLLSLPMQLLAGLAAAAAAERRGLGSAPVRIGIGVAAAGATLVVSRVASAVFDTGLSDYDHVFDLLWAKLRYLGERPEDPALLSFGARLLWQGPFETPYLRELLAGFSVGAVLLPVAAFEALPTWLRGRGRERFAVLVAFGLLTVASAVLIRRNLVLPALVLPAVSAALLHELRLPRATPWIAGLVLAQVLAAASILPHRELRWYFPLQQDELAAVVRWMNDEVPPEAGLAADFVTSTAVLAHNGNPILLQPKYETRESRDRARAFFESFFFDTPADFRELLRRYECRYLLIDRQTLWGFRYIAGLPPVLTEPIPGTAAAVFLSTKREDYEVVRGFRLRYRSELPSDMMRLYEIR